MIPPPHPIHSDRWSPGTLASGGGARGGGRRPPPGRYIPSPLIRLVHPLGIYPLPSSDWDSPPPRMGQASFPFLSRAERVLASLPANVFASSVPGQPRFTVLQRGAAFVVKGAELGLVGTGCGFAGQTVANTALVMRQKIAGLIGGRKGEEEGQEVEE
eukprot:52488-Prorocentrum_minimum.AAC.1